MSRYQKNESQQNFTGCSGETAENCSRKNLINGCIPPMSMRVWRLARGRLPELMILQVNLSIADKSKAAQ